jgi:hypothetical protein
MGLFSRRRARPATVTRQEVDDVRRYLEDFVNTRVGVEAYLEPATTVTPTTVLLVATTGEWTRRRVFDPAVVHHLSEKLNVPVYDVRLMGYPQRMRDWNERAKIEARRAQRQADEG